MWPSFWISVGIGLVAALPILNHPDLKAFWFYVGLGVSVFQSGALKAVFEPQWVKEQICGEISDGTAVCVDHLRREHVGDYFSWPDIIGGMVVDVAATFATGILVVIIAFLLVSDEAAKAKYRDTFPLMSFFLDYGFNKKK